MLKLYYFDDNNIPVTKEHWQIEENMSAIRLTGLIASYFRGQAGGENSLANSIVINNAIETFKRFEKNKQELVNFQRNEEIILLLLIKGVCIRKTDIDLITKSIDIKRKKIEELHEPELIYCFEVFGALKKILEMAAKNENVEYIAFETDGMAAEYIAADIYYPNFLTDTLSDFENLDWIFDTIREFGNNPLQRDWLDYEQQKLNG